MPGLRPKYAISLTKTQVRELTHLSWSYTAAFGEVQRARLLLCAHDHPEWSNTRIAREVGCSLDTVKKWRARWSTQATLGARPRSGAPRAFTPQRACTDHGSGLLQPRRAWQGLEALSAVRNCRPWQWRNSTSRAISASTIRRWLREEKIKPWRYHSWQKSTDPQFVEKAGPVLDLYEDAQQLARNGEAVCCADERPSIQARERVDATLSAVPSRPVRVAAEVSQAWCTPTLLCLAGLNWADLR